MKLFGTNKMSLSLGIIFILFLFYTCVLSSLYFIYDIGLNSWVAPFAFGLSCVSSYFIIGKKDFNPGSILVALIYMISTIALCGLIYDSTFDSIGYHYDTVVMMAQGWNPFVSQPWNDNIWAMHYAKALEMMQASIMALTGNLQTVKCINFIFLASALSLLWYTLQVAFVKISNKWRIILVLSAAANPIVIWQMLSGYNDYALWLETIVLLCSFVLCLKNQQRAFPYVLVFVVFSLSINTKFTHFFYLGIECIFLAVWCCCFNYLKVLKYSCVAVVSAVVVGVAILGYNPYVINTLEYGSPFYPLGTDDVDIMTGNTPAMFNYGGRLVNFVKSLLSERECAWSLLNGNVSIDGIRSMYSGDMKINGFGVLMAPILVLGFVIMVCSNVPFKYWIVYISVFALSLSFEQSWWSRYIPFIWLAVILPLLLSFYYGRLNKFQSILRAMTVFLIMINGSISLAATLYSRLSYTFYINYVFDRQKESREPIKVYNLNYALRQQFSEAGVDIIELDCLSSIGNRHEIFRVFGTEYFDAVMALPEEQYPQLYEEPLTLRDRMGRYGLRKFYRNN